MDQILSAIYYCHQIGIIHRDLKLENVLFSDIKKLEIKVVDFGIAGHCNYNHGEMTDSGTVRYMPPEVLSRKDLQASRAMDIWACGVILFTMLFNQLPFDGKDKEDLINNIVKSKLHFPLKETNKFLTEEVKDLISKMLDKNPQERISMIDILDHEWFKMTDQEIEEALKPHQDVDNDQLEEEKNINIEDISDDDSKDNGIRNYLQIIPTHNGSTRKALSSSRNKRRKASAQKSESKNSKGIPKQTSFKLNAPKKLHGIKSRSKNRGNETITPSPHTIKHKTHPHENIEINEFPLSNKNKL